MTSSRDRIERRVHLRAPRERVWRAISRVEEFGSWFGARFDGPFLAGARLEARIAPTSVDPEIAKAQEPYRGTPFEVFVERVEPPRHLSIRWHPYAVDAAVDYSGEPTTLVSFDLEETPDGTLLTISESGFEALPPERRAKALESNKGGWAAQATLIEKYLARQA